METIRKATTEERAKVRTITFKTKAGFPGTVTGIPLTCDSREVWMYSAGCLHQPPYVIPATATIVKIERAWR